VLVNQLEAQSEEFLAKDIANKKNSTLCRGVFGSLYFKNTPKIC